MGRPKEHGDRTAAALLASAERTVQEEGLEALSIRGVADDVGTTTRAVYSLFGSKDGLIVALAARAFELLGAEVAAVPRTEDPIADLIECGLTFRRFAIEHPSLFAIGVQRKYSSTELWQWQQFRDSAAAALAVLAIRVERLAEADLLGGRSVNGAAFQFHGLCEGLAAMESRLAPPQRRPMKKLWTEALSALVTGFATSSNGALDRSA